MAFPERRFQQKARLTTFRCRLRKQCVTSEWASPLWRPFRAETETIRIIYGETSGHEATASHRLKSPDPFGSSEWAVQLRSKAYNQCVWIVSSLALRSAARRSAGCGCALKLSCDSAQPNQECPVETRDYSASCFRLIAESSRFTHFSRRPRA
jgi:hypothetical protein